MRMRLLLLTLCAALCLWPAPPEVDAKSRMVVVISLDGFPAYALEDPSLPVPTLRRLAREGVSARMGTVNPTVTWPNHTSMVTGLPPAGHGVLYNGLPVRDGEGRPVRVEPWRPKEELVQRPTVYDAAHQAGLTTAEVDWVAISDAKTITWSFGERPTPNGKVEREMVAAGLVTADEIAGFAKANITWRDEVWTQAGIHLIRAHKPNLLLFHLLNTDSSHHRYGPRTLAGNSALALADQQVGRLLRAIDDAGMRDKSTVLVVSDHGFKTAKRSIRPNALFRERGLLREREGKVECDAFMIPEGGSAMVYVTRSERRAELLPTLRESLGALEGVSRVVGEEGFAGMGLPMPAPNGRMADLVLLAKDGYAFAGAYDGEAVVDIPASASPGNHGYINTDPEMDAIFVAWGYGVRRGTTLGKVRNVDVASTVARLLGLTMAGVQGRAVGVE